MFSRVHLWCSSQINFLILKSMNDRYKFRNNEIFRYQEEAKELSEENEHLKQRILKYEQINDYIDVLINANHQLEEQLKARALQEQSLLAELEMKVREEERTEAAKIEQLLKDKVIAAEIKVKEVVEQYEGIVMQQVQLLKKAQLSTQQLETQLTQAYKKLKQQQTELQNLNQDNHHLETALNQSTLQHTKCKEDKKIVQRALDASEAELIKVKQYNKEIVQNFHQREKQLQGRNDEMLLQLEEQEQIIQRADRYVRHMKEELKDTIMKLQNSYRASEEKDIQAGKMKATLESLESSYQMLEKNHEQLLEEYRKCCLNKVQLENMNEQLHNSLNRRQQQMDQLQNSKDEQANRDKIAIREYEVQIKTLSKLLGDKNLQYQTTNSALNTLRIQYTNLQTRILEQQKTNEAKQEQIYALQKRIIEFQAQLMINNKKNHAQELKLKENQENLYRIRGELLAIEQQLTHQKKINSQKQKQLIQQYEKKLNQMIKNLASEKENLNKTFQIQKQRIKSTFEFALEQHENLAKKKLDILEKDIDQYRLNLQKRQRSERGRSHPKTTRFF